MRLTATALALVFSVAACKSADRGVTPPPASGTSIVPAPSATTSATTNATPPSSPPPAAAASIAAPGASASAAPAPAPKQAYRIAAVGDSLTDPNAHGGGYLAYVQRQCPETRVDNFGKGALMLNQIRRRFEETVHNQPAGSYTHVVVWGGVNDLYSDVTAGRTPKKAEADLAVIYEKSRNKGAQVVAITISPWGGFVRYHNERRQGYTLEVNQWIKDQLAAGKVDAVVDAYALLSCGDETRLCPEFAQRKSDGLHLGKAGHEVLGKALYEAVFANCR
ncbi:MAG TPA: SGNH/GDSL hydrolase family protein [Polyangiaceae bacterium]|nr:SGNH/GDSL hydrolase family protein [Polyangiaceae bacterium]